MNVDMENSDDNTSPKYVVVPTTPTTDMLYAMAECDGYSRGDRDHPSLVRWEDYWHMALIAWSKQKGNQKDLSDEQISKIADSIPVDELLSHETTWHIKFARKIISAVKNGYSDDLL